MATTAVTLNGQTFFVPQPGEQGPTYDQDLTNYLVALATAFPQGGASPSSTFQALVSAGANPATAGRIRLAAADLVDWRNQATTGNDSLSVDANDNLNWTSSASTPVFWQNLPQQLTGNPGAVYNTTAGQLITTGTFQQINFATSVTDTDLAVTTGASWKFTVPAGKGGFYSVSSTCRFTGLTANTGILQLAIFGNAALAFAGPATDASNGATQGLSVSGTLLLAAAGTIDVRVFQSQGASRNLTTLAAENIISIKRVA